MTTVAVLIPSVGRPAQLAERVGSLLVRRPLPAVYLEVVLAIPMSDTASLAAAARLSMGPMPYATRLHIALRRPDTTAVEGWNVAYRYIESICAPDWFVLGADDLVWPEGWLEAALCIAAETGAQVIGLGDDNVNLDDFSAHYMASRLWCEEQLGGNIAPPEYAAWWFDREVSQRAQKMGLYAPCWNAHLQHTHPMYGTAEMDDTYRRGYALHDADKALYQRWQKGLRP